jgi:hypothetical protein
MRSSGMLCLFTRATRHAQKKLQGKYKERLRELAELLSTPPHEKLGWWNWQTRTFEGRMAKAVRVQVPPRAPPPLRRSVKGSNRKRKRAVDLRAESIAIRAKSSWTRSAEVIPTKKGFGASCESPTAPGERLQCFDLCVRPMAQAGMRWAFGPECISRAFGLAVILNRRVRSVVAVIPLVAF